MGEIITVPSISQRLRKAIQGFFAASFLLFLLLILNLAQMLSLVLIPFSRQLFRRVNRTFADLWWGLCADALASLQGFRVEITGSTIPEQENAIVVCNHQQMADIAVLFFLAKPKNRLGDMKWFVKNELKYVPGLGWGMQFLDCLFVKRDWYADKNRIEATFDKFHNENIPIWLMIFPEGTRRTPLKQRASQHFAKTKGWPELHHVLIPRTKGFVAATQGLKNHVGHIYDVTIGYIGKSPNLWQLITGQVPRVCVHVQRYALADLPPTSYDVAQWLLDRYIEKDQRLEAFYFTGQFPASQKGMPKPTPRNE